LGGCGAGLVVIERKYKGGMALSYKGIWGYAPLIISLANSREVLFGMDAHPKVVKLAEALPQEAWKPLERLARYEIRLNSNKGTKSDMGIC
jgi:hypothetical protein